MSTVALLVSENSNVGRTVFPVGELSNTALSKKVSALSELMNDNVTDPAVVESARAVVAVPFVVVKLML